MSALNDIIEQLKLREITPSWFRSRDWQSIEPALRRRAFFSATVQSAKVLTRMRSYLIDWTLGVKEEVISPAGVKEVAYKDSGLADFREKMTELLISEGLVDPAELPQNDKITNVAGNTRLALIFNTNTEQAATFAEWQKRMSDPRWLDRYPAARFVRRPGAIIKRPLHVQNEGVVKKWNDPFWLSMNGAEIGGFEVPWGPYGFNSYMVQQPVKREEAERLKVIRKGEKAVPPDAKQYGVDLGQQFNTGVDANLDDVPFDVRRQAEDRIKSRFGQGAIGPDGKPTLDALKRLRTQI